MSREFGICGSSAGGGGFTPKFGSGIIVIAASATGTILTLTPPSGQKVKLTNLAAQSVTQTNKLTILFAGVAVVTAVLLEVTSGNANTTDAYMMGRQISVSDPLTGAVDEALTITTDIATTNGTVYAYQFGE